MMPVFRCFFGMMVLMAFICGCRHPGHPDQSQDQPSEKVIIKNYGEALFSLDPLNIEAGFDSLMTEYRFFLGDEKDTLKIIQVREFIMDPLNRELAGQCKRQYGDLNLLEDELTLLFGQGKMHNPQFITPVVYTYVSGLLYEYPVQYLDSVLLIGLDMFLGRDYEPYRAIGMPVYMTRRMEQQNIVPECARQISLSMIPGGTAPKTLLDHMVLEGKVLYAMDLLVPGVPDSLKIGYTSAQAEWCINNEKDLWRMLIDQELLYTSDPLVVRRFIQDGPFTAGLPEGAPAMLGKWAGWRIVRSYMNKNKEVTLTGLFNIADSQVILSRSGYKPKK